jgi:hypothetical protein
MTKVDETKSVLVEGYVVKRFVRPGSEETGGDSGETIDRTQVSIQRFVTTPAEVLYEAGGTINMGNYESARVTVGIRVPCYREEIESAYVIAKDWVEKKLEAEVSEIRRAGV